jgi:DNA-binding beta-propeller fold protein YncE
LAKQTKTPAISRRSVKIPKPAAIAPAPVSAQTPAGSSVKEKAIVVAGVLVVALLLAQGAYVYMNNKKQVRVLNEASTIAVRGEGKGTVTGCRHLAVSKEGDVAYIFGTGPGCVLQKFTKNGQFAGIYEPKAKEQKLNNAWAVAFDSQGRVWVCERGSGRVLRLSSKLAFEKAVTLTSPDLTGLVVDSQDHVYVASDSPKVFILDGEGSLIKEFTGDDKSAMATAYRLAVDAKDDLYVLDAGRGQSKDPDIKVYDKEGRSISSFMARGVPFNEFSCIGWDPQGFVVLNNNGMNAPESKGIELFSPKGKLVAVAQASNTGLSMMSIPGLAIGAGGDWALDVTPLGKGCTRFLLAQAPKK